MKNYIFYDKTERELEQQLKLYIQIETSHSLKNINIESVLELMTCDIIKTFKLPDEKTFYSNLSEYKTITEDN